MNVMGSARNDIVTNNAEFFPVRFSPRFVCVHWGGVRYWSMWVGFL